MSSEWRKSQLTLKKAISNPPGAHRLPSYEQYSYEFDQLNTPSTNSQSHSYDLTLSQSVNTPTISNVPSRSHYHTQSPLHPIHTPSHSTSINSSTNNSKSKKKKSKRSPAEKFAKEFYKKGKVKKVMRGNKIIGTLEACLMLSYFRNVDVENVDDSDMALKYLEGISVKHLKRILREMNETIRRTFYYGTDFHATHSEQLLKETTTPFSRSHASYSLHAIAENTTCEGGQKSVNLKVKPVVNLSELKNESLSSLDQYLHSPHTLYTPSVSIATHNSVPSFSAAPISPRSTLKLDTVNNESNTSNINKFINDDDDDNYNQEEEKVFNPLKGATNFQYKPNKPLPFKKNFATNFNEKKQVVDDDKNDNNHTDTPYNDINIHWKTHFNKKPSNTKMFGKYFDKRGSNISHGSIWSESADDDDENQFDADDDDDDEMPFLMAKLSVNSNEEDDEDNEQDQDDDEQRLKMNAFYHTKSTSSQYLSPPENNGQRKVTKPTKGGKEHISQFSFASTVSLGSECSNRMTDDEMDDDDDDELKTIMSINEEKEIDHEQDLKEVNNIADSLAYRANSPSPPLTKKKKQKKQKKSKRLKLIKIDSALLDDEDEDDEDDYNNSKTNANSTNNLYHEQNYSLDSFLSDMEMPEPTATEKLKYHLTEPRNPPDRRRTYNYSHDVKKK